MRKTLGDLSVYGLVDGEEILTGEDMLKKGGGWEDTFRYLARRHMTGNACTLWVDLFALSMIFMNQPLSPGLLIVPLLCEGCTVANRHQVRLTVIEPKQMLILDRRLEPRYPEKVIVLPIYMFDHNPHMIRTDRSIYPEYFKQTTEDYIAALKYDLVQSEFVSDELDPSRRKSGMLKQDWSHKLKLFDGNVVLPETQEMLNHRTREVAEKEKLALDEALDKKKKAQEAKELLDKAEQEKKKKEDEIAQQQKGKEWKIKTKKRWSQKVGQGQNDKWVKEDKLVDAKNPEYMYPDLGSPWNSRYLEHDDPEPVREWWNDSRNNSKVNYFEPDDDHLFDQDDINALAATATKEEKKPKSWIQILQAARSIETNIPLMTGRGLDRAYSEQDLIDLSCLLDTGRQLDCDTRQQPNKDRIELLVDSYVIDLTLTQYRRQPAKTPKRQQRVEFDVYKDWLKAYLDFYNPGYYEFFVNAVSGTKVQTVSHKIASAEDSDYRNFGKYTFHQDVVTLPKSHPPRFLDNRFIAQYGSKSSQKDRCRRREFNYETEKKVNPSSLFDKVPFPKCMSKTDKLSRLAEGQDKPHFQKVPAIYVQVTGVKVEMRYSGTKKSGETAERWLGVQNDRFIGLPEAWVKKNMPDDVIEEAQRRGRQRLKGKRGGIKERFVTLPPGDTRVDEPPLELCNVEKGENYYYQEMIDNCLMGGFANAIAEMCGDETAQSLLIGWNPFDHKHEWRWKAFFDRVCKVLSPHLGRVSLQKVKEKFTLSADDRMPVVLQLKGRDGSATHSVTVFQGNIYDSASRHVLHKNEETLHWCCGDYGFAETLRAYVLVVEDRKPKALKLMKKRKRIRVNN
jgi:hypothetical protein